MNRARFSQEGDTNFHCIAVVIVDVKIILFSDPKYFVLMGNINNCKPIAILFFLL
jgi:hypothetical protein